MDKGEKRGGTSWASTTAVAWASSIKVGASVAMKVVIKMIMFDGKGYFVCIDGRSYEGEWSQGKRCGFGRQVLCPAVERGDATRRHIGGNNGLYRPLKYVGGWQDDKRQGHGLLERMDGRRWKGCSLMVLLMVLLR